MSMAMAMEQHHWRWAVGGGQRTMAIMAVWPRCRAHRRRFGCGVLCYPTANFAGDVAQRRLRLRTMNAWQGNLRHAVPIAACGPETRASLQRPPQRGGATDSTGAQGTTGAWRRVGVGEHGRCMCRRGGLWGFGTMQTRAAAPSEWPGAAGQCGHTSRPGWCRSGYILFLSCPRALCNAGALLLKNRD